MKNKTVRNILIFVIVSLSSGWLGYWIDLSIPPQPDEETLGMGLWLVLPLVTALMLRLFAGDGWKDIGLRPGLSTHLKWYLVSLVIFPIVTIFLLAIGKLTGWIDFSNFRTTDYFIGILITLIPNFIKNIFEEFVWRGYLTAKLMNLALKDYWIYLIVGGVWGAWHIPYYLYFLPESLIFDVLPVERGLFAVIAILTMMFWSVMFVEIYRLTHSIWPVVILHMIEDSVINHLVIDKYIIFAPGKEILLSPIAGVFATILYLIIGLLLRKNRKEKEMTLQAKSNLARSRTIKY
jgi:membrane protease YdiL (CAAX protease family)